jgi:hypothetical protein
MQKIFILFSIVLTITFLTGFQARTSGNRKGNCDFIEESLRNISELKVGMKRKDLLVNFGEEGGISSRSQKHYVYNKCSFIKINVRFEPVGNATDKLNESPDDKIIEISKPYLEYEITD